MQRTYQFAEFSPTRAEGSVFDTLVAAGWPVTAAETIVVKGKQAPLSVGRFTAETALRHAGQH